MDAALIYPSEAHEIALRALAVGEHSVCRPPTSRDQRLEHGFRKKGIGGGQAVWDCVMYGDDVGDVPTPGEEWSDAARIVEDVQFQIRGNPTQTRGTDR